MKFWITLSAGTMVGAALVACSSAPSAEDVSKRVEQTVKNSFRAEGQAGLDRLNQDEANRACSDADATGQPLDEKVAKAIEASNMKTIAWPADGQFLGDWKKGEEIAQSGRGKTWTDAINIPNGGNCYNCHQISREEISFGTLGPSLFNYGKIRGITNPEDPAARPIVEYTWGKIWNARAYNACSQMPRAGHNGVLTQAQIKDLMALLLDPQSPVNQ